MNLLSSKFSFLEIVLAIIAGILFGIIVVRAWPELTDTNPWWWSIFGGVIVLRLIYKLFQR